MIKYIDYHVQSHKMGDIDPGNDMLVYIADRFELNMEQRYWVAFLFSTCYCAATTFYIYNEFPDFAGVDVNRMQRWWDKNKQRCVFQTDRLRIKSSNQFVPTFESYKALIGNTTQQQYFDQFRTSNVNINYQNAYVNLGKVRNVGRFTLFIYLELINLLTNYKCEPETIDWKHADNCSRGLGFAMFQEDLLGYSNDQALQEITRVINKKVKSNIFNIETTLCAYAKYNKDKRYIGYYIDRQKKEIEKMKQNVTEGVCWLVLDQFRLETYKPHPNLQEPI